MGISQFLKRLTQADWLHLWLLLLWTVLGTVLRLTQLEAKPLWTDEFATIVFSLGHGFRTVPLDRVLDATTLLQPVQMSPITTAGDVVERLMSESTHPPLYFILAHWWMRWVSPDAGLISTWVARSLPAILGGISIPAMFGLGYAASRSQQVGQVAAALMAVSPYGVFLAQDARHYSLAVLWMIASLTCFAIALRRLQQRRSLPLWLVLLWIAANSLGMATHYFFALTLSAEGLALVAVWGLERASKSSKFGRQSPGWSRICAVAIGTLAGSLIWLPFWQGSYSSEITQWIYSVDKSSLAWINPILFTLATGFTMLVVLPIQNVPEAVQMISAAIVTLVGIGISWLVMRGLRLQLQGAGAWGLWGLIGVTVGAIVLLLTVDYGLGADITRGFRYSFIYFPGVLLLVAIGLASYTPSAPRILLATLGLILLMGILGSLTVSFNLAYQKTHRPDLVASRMQTLTQEPMLVTIAHHTHGQTGRLMAIAWELQQSSRSVQYYLDHQTCNPKDLTCDAPTPRLRQALLEFPRPFSLWLINYRGAPDLHAEGCTLDSRPLRRGPTGTERVDGYKYQLYHCQNREQGRGNRGEGSIRPLGRPADLPPIDDKRP